MTFLDAFDKMAYKSLIEKTSYDQDHSLLKENSFSSHMSTSVAGNTIDCSGTLNGFRCVVQGSIKKMLGGHFHINPHVVEAVLIGTVILVSVILFFIVKKIVHRVISYVKRRRLIASHTAYGVAAGAALGATAASSKHHQSKLHVSPAASSSFSFGEGGFSQFLAPNVSVLDTSQSGVVGVVKKLFIKIIMGILVGASAVAAAVLRVLPPIYNELAETIKGL